MSEYKSLNDLHICFLGCGNITKKHALILSKFKHVKCSFASRSIDKAKEYKEKLKGEMAFGDYSTAYTHPDVNVIMVNTPPSMHYEFAKLALENGKHCIVEKPPFQKVSEFKELYALAQTKNLQLLVAENYYYKPLRKKIESLIHENVIGTPLFIQINATKYQNSKNDWREDKNLSGFGALFEGGIHWINFMNNIGLEITDAHGYVPGEKKDLERSIQVTCNTKERAVINLIYSWEVNTKFAGLRISKIYGTEGSITFESNGIFVIPRGRKTRLHFPQLTKITGFQLMWEDYVSSLINGTSPQMDTTKGIRDLEIVESIYKKLEIEA